MTVTLYFANLYQKQLFINKNDFSVFQNILHEVISIHFCIQFKVHKSHLFESTF